MKHLFIYILCSILCCGAYAQTNAQSPPPGVKFRTMKAEKAMRSGKFGKKDAFMQQQKASKTAPQAKIQNDLRRNRIGKPAAVQAPRLQSAKAIEGDQARITLYVQTDWGDGSGYQLILDKECEITGTTTLDEIFAAADYTLPSNAAVLENFLKAGESASVDIPAGEYDFYVFNPTPSDGTVYIAGGEAVGDNFEFKGGVEYVFTINVDLTSGDNVEITTDSPVEIGVSEIISPVSGRGLSAEESVTAKIFNNGTEEVTSFTATYTLDGGQPVSETVNTAIAPGGSIDYTFTAKADFSAAGVHNLTVSVDNEKDGLPGNNSVMAKIIHITPVPAPYVCKFDSEDCINEWSIIDANGDGSTWAIYLEEMCAQILYNSYNNSDDYLVTVCPVKLSAGTNKVVLDYNAMGSGYYESFEVLYGKTDDVSEMTVLKKFDNFTANEEAPYVGVINFDTTEDGEYYFAIHATSEANQLGVFIYRVEISEGVYVGTPDLSVDKVTLPISSCSLGEAEKVSAVVSNKGTADAKDFTVEYSVNGTVKGTQKYDMVVPTGGSVEITLDETVDMSAAGKYEVGIKVTDVTPADGQNPEEVTDNNYKASTATHYTPTDIPFTVDFTDEGQRGEWASDDSWAYDSEYYNALYCNGTTPLVSRGMNLKAGKAYRLSYNYMAGMFYFIFAVYDNYDIIIGKDGTPVSEWSTVESFTDIYTEDVFTDNAVTFTVPSDGVYSLGFKQDLPQATFMLRSASVTEVAPYDVTVTGITSLPSKLPKSQAEGLTVGVSVKNNGSEPASGTVSLTIGDKEIGTATFTDIPATETETVNVPVTLSEVDPGMAEIKAEATIDGEEDNNPTDNAASVSLEVTDDVYAYDYVTDGMYDEYHAIGVGEDYPCTAGIVFHINNETEVKGISVGWGVVSGEQIGLAIYKWDATATPDAEGYLPIGEEVCSTTADQGNSVGQIDYMFDEPTKLEPGDYMFTVSYTGYALAVDNVTPGQLYLLMDNNGTLAALDQTAAGLGTPAIRALLGYGTVGVNTIETAVKTPAITYDAASKTIVASSPASAIKSLEVYSASGSKMGNKAGSTNVCRYDASRLAPGVYVVQMNTAGGVVTSKLAIK